MRRNRDSVGALPREEDTRGHKSVKIGKEERGVRMGKKGGQADFT